MKYGWVNISIIDLWTKPLYNSERASQLLFGTLVKIQKEKNNYFFISLPDHYTGWVDARFVAPINRTVYYDYMKNINSIVASSTTKVYNHSSKILALPYFLYYGTKLLSKPSKNDYVRIILPDKNRFFVKMNNIKPINSKRDEIKGRTLISEAKRFLGVPYLWGGVTITGFDCSGFIQTVLSRFGIIVPRDTKDQIFIGEKIERNSIMTGDLLFFKRHVGFAIGKDRIIHSSVGGGGVRINSLVPSKSDYRKDLDKSFNQARRILCSN